MQCKHCNIETEGIRAESGYAWPLCGECFTEVWRRIEAEDEHAREAAEAKATYDPLTICARCRFTWPVSELAGGLCPDCNLRAWEIEVPREVLR